MKRVQNNKQIKPFWLFNKQLLNEAEQVVKNYAADRGGCYPPRLKAEVDNILRDLH